MHLPEDFDEVIIKKNKNIIVFNPRGVGLQ